MIGSSPALSFALERARQAAATDADILIEAESGTGKELLARMIHSLSARRDQPFVAIDCAGLPESLLENELFGHGRGAFAAQPGKFEIADGGTLLLDEIGEMPLSLQPKLLRALQEREFYRLGEARPVKVNLRIIATTNRELSAMVREGSFRADLYYRLNVIPLSLPPLRERQEDIPELAQHFARQFQADGGPAELSDAFVEKLAQHSWPGNIRELANVVRRAIALPLETTELLADVAPKLQEPQPRAGIARLHAGMSLESMQKRLLEMTLEATAGNRSHAAEMLGISLRTVRNKIREYHLPPRRQYAHGNVDFNIND